MDELTVIEAFDSPGRGPAGLAWDGMHIWNADFREGRVFSLEKETGEVTNSFVCPGVLSGLTWDGVSLWQALMDEGWLRSINPNSHDFDRTITVSEAGRLAGVAWDGTHLWAASQQRGQLLAIDRESGQIRRAIDVPVAAGGVAFRDGFLWVGVPEFMEFDDMFQAFNWVSERHDFFLLQLEATTGREAARYSLEFLPMGVCWVGKDLLMSNASQQRLVRARLTPEGGKPSRES